MDLVIQHFSLSKSDFFILDKIGIKNCSIVIAETAFHLSFEQLLQISPAAIQH
jgi:hypothetical protein